MNDFPIQPTHNYVFIKKDDASKTESGLHLPQSIKGRAPTGIVLAAGPGHLNVNTGTYVENAVKPGQRVFIQEFSGYMVRYQNHEAFVFRDSEILGIVDESKPFPIQPCFDYVFVVKDEVQKTDSGLHLPQSIKSRATIGTVVATGPGHLNVESSNYIPCGVKPGQKVYVKEFGGFTVKFKDHEAHVFKDLEIVGVLKEQNV